VGVAKHNLQWKERERKGEGFEINVTLLEVSLTSPARPSDKNTEEFRKVGGTGLRYGRGILA
jgi:hypothetical protein